MSIMLDEAQAYENSRDYDCCQIIEGAYTVGDAVYEAYCDGREALPTNAEIEAVAKDEDDAWDYAGEILGYQEDFIERAKDVLQAARNAVQTEGKAIK